MIIDTMYENLAKFQMQKLKESQAKKRDRELLAEFGEIKEDIDILKTCNWCYINTPGVNGLCSSCEKIKEKLKVNYE